MGGLSGEMIFSLCFSSRCDHFASTSVPSMMCHCMLPPANLKTIKPGSLSLLFVSCSMELSNTFSSVTSLYYLKTYQHITLTCERSISIWNQGGSTYAQRAVSFRNQQPRGTLYKGARKLAIMTFFSVLTHQCKWQQVRMHTHYVTNMTIYFSS